jgi:hypothetical protein
MMPGPAYDERETELREAERRHIAALEALAREARTPAAVLNCGASRGCAIAARRLGSTLRDTGVVRTWSGFSETRSG